MQEGRIDSQGQELGIIQLVGIVNATMLQNLTFRFEDNFADDWLELGRRTRGNSCIMIQALTDTYDKGMALLSFEQDTGHRMLFSSHNMGADLIQLSA